MTQVKKLKLIKDPKYNKTINPHIPSGDVNRFTFHNRFHVPRLTLDYASASVRNPGIMMARIFSWPRCLCTEGRAVGTISQTTLLGHMRQKKVQLFIPPRRKGELWERDLTMRFLAYDTSYKLIRHFHLYLRVVTTIFVWSLSFEFLQNS